MLGYNLAIQDHFCIYHHIAFLHQPFGRSWYCLVVQCVCSNQYTFRMESENIVKDLISIGLTLFAGFAKVGKSWLALWLSIAVAKGENVWGYESTRCTTLYLCYEDNEIRIQNRLLEITDDAPSNVHFCTEVSKLGGKLETRIRNFIAEHQDTKLIIIDTLQTIRSPNTERTYSNDYSDLTILKNLADDYKIGILLIHHFRKQKDGDVFNQITGSTGLQGAVDTMFTLSQSKRGEKAVTLSCVGRNIESRELELERSVVRITFGLSFQTVSQKAI